MITTRQNNGDGWGHHHDGYGDGTGGSEANTWEKGDLSEDLERRQKMRLPNGGRAGDGDEHGDGLGGGYSNYIEKPHPWMLTASDPFETLQHVLP